MANTLDRVIKSIKDKNDDYFLRLGNESLMVFDDGKKLNIVVLYNKITSKWIKNNIDVNIEKEDFPFAVGLNGKIYDIDIEILKIGNVKINDYLYEGKRLTPLYTHSNKSKNLFWTAEKYKVLSPYHADDKFSYKTLQDIIEPAINQEHLNNKENKIDL